MPFKTFEKDPAAKKKYSVDWTEWLGADNISASVWTVPAGIVNESSSFTTKIATVVISGGTVGQTYTLTNRITTNNATPEIDERSIRIKIKEQ